MLPKKFFRRRKMKCWESSETRFPKVSRRTEPFSAVFGRSTSAAPVSSVAPKKKSFDRGGPVWPPWSNATDDRLGGGSGGLCPPNQKSGGLGGGTPQPKTKNFEFPRNRFLEKIFQEKQLTVWKNSLDIQKFWGLIKNWNENKQEQTKNKESKIRWHLYPGSWKRWVLRWAISKFRWAISIRNFAERFRNRSAKFRNRSAQSLSETQRKISSRFALTPLKG